jgi:[ribosomal protein S5]-alanine N-acetyltransferase
MFPTLETDRLILREITKEDTDAIFSSFSNDKVTRYYGQDTMKSIEEAEKSIYLQQITLKNEAFGGALRERAIKKSLGQLDFMLGCQNINVLKSVMKSIPIIGEKDIPAKR